MNTNIFKKKSAMIITALFCCLLWGSAFPSIKILYTMTGVSGTYEKMMLAGIRFTLSGVFVLLFLKLVQKKSMRVNRKSIKLVLLIAFLQTFLSYSFYYVGLSNTTGVRASIIVSTGIFHVAILSLFMFKGYKLTTGKIIGMVLGLGGVIIANLSGLSSGQALQINGEGFILLSAFIVSLASIFIKKYAGKMDIVLLNGWQLFIGGVLLIAVAYTGYPSLISFDAKSLMLLIYTSLLSAIAFSLWYILIQCNDVASVTLFKFTIPIFGSMLSILFLPEETFSLVIVPALVLIAGGIILFTKNELPTKHHS